MTAAELRARLCGSARRFTLAMADLKDRLGLPDEIHLMRRWCRDTGRDVARLTYKVDDGEVEVFCPMGFLNGQEAALDGWVMAAGPRTSAADQPRQDGGGLPPRQLALFESESSPPATPPEADSTSWRAQGQLTFDALYRVSPPPVDERSSPGLGPNG